MEVNVEGGLPLKHFTRALTCLTRFGEELDFVVSPNSCAISTVNSSRTAFAVVHFYPRFFQEYRLLPTHDRRNGVNFKFSVNGKALLSPLRPRSANTIESCTIQVGGSEDPNLARLEPGVDAGECRIIIRLNCQHGVVKTHRLTYSNPNVNSWARFDKTHCTSTWKASSKILKEWTDHFYLRSGSHSLTDEITFYCSELTCRLKSFIDTTAEQAMSENEIMTSRPLTTELSVATEDFDLWDISDQTIITFALKEFKAIINLSEALALPLSSHFTEGGRPVMIEVEGDHLEAKFVIATSNYDTSNGMLSGSVKTSGSGSVNGALKREKSETAPRSTRRESTMETDGGGRYRAGGGAAAAVNSGRLFNTPTPSPAPQLRSNQQTRQQQQEVAEEGDGDEFDWGGFDDADAAFAEIDHLSQVASSQQQQRLSQKRQETAEPTKEQGGGATAGGSGLGYSKSGAKILVRDTSEAGPSSRSGRTEQQEEAGNGSKYEEEEEFGRSPEPVGTEETVLGPTQGYPTETNRPKKKPRWNILGDE